MKSSRFCGSLFALSLTVLMNLGQPALPEESPFKLDSATSNIIEGATINLRVESGVQASTSRLGSPFLARVVESVYAEDGNVILIPKGSWVTGRVVSVQAPARFSKAGKLNLNLDYLTLLDGQSFPINALLSFEKGKVNKLGVLDPQTGFRDKALSPTRKLLQSDAGQIASIVTLGLPVVATLVGGSAFAAIAKGDTIGLLPGETFSIVLRDSSLSIKQ